MNNDDIEDAAVAYIKHIVRQNPTLEADLQTNDKTPLVDGEFRHYLPDKSKKVENFKWAVRAQVKGHELKQKEQFANRAKFKMKKRYLRAFEGYNGVIFVVVHMKDNECKAYFRIYGPFDIQEELKRMGGRKSVQVVLDPFPTDHKAQNRILSLASEKCQRFDIVLTDEMVASATGLEINTVDPIDFSKPGMVGIGTSTPSHIQIELGDGNKIPVPGVVEYWPEDYLPQEMAVPLKSGDIVVADAHRHFVNNELLEIAITPSLRVEVTKGERTGNVRLSFESSFKETLNNLEFLSNWSRTGVVEIGGKKVSSSLASNSLEGLTETLEFARKANQFFRKLEVDTSLVSAKDVLEPSVLLRHLIEHLVGSQNLQMSYAPPQRFVVEVGEKQLRFIAHDTDERGQLKVCGINDLGSGQLWWKPDDGSEEFLRVSVFEILDVEAIGKTLNLGLSDIQDKYLTYVDERNRSSWANDTVLKLIEAADCYADRRIEFLEAALDLSELVASDPSMKDIAQINKWQIEARLNQLGDVDYKEIREFREMLPSDGQFSPALKAGASVLLGQSGEVDFWLSRTEEGDKSRFKETPIYRFHTNRSDLIADRKRGSEPDKWEEYRQRCMLRSTLER